MGWLIAAAIIIIVVTLKLSVRVSFIDDMALSVGVGFFKIKLFPNKEKKLRLSDYKIKKFRKNQAKAELRQAKAEAKKLAKQQKKDAKKQAEISEGESADEKPKRDILGLLGKLTEVIKVFISRFGHHLRIDLRRLVIIIATEDAASTAVLYGAVCGGVQCLLELLYNCTHLTIPKDEAFYENISVTTDFTSQKTRSEVDITLSFRLWQLFDILIRSAIAYLKA